MTATLAEIEKALAPGVHWKDAYKFVGDAAMAVLVALPPDARLETIDLVEAIYPGERPDIDERIFRALKALAAYQLKDCWEHGPRKERFGKSVAAKFWKKPIIKACPHCGGAL